MNSNFRTHLMSKIAPCIASILAFLLVMALILTFINLEVSTRAQTRQMEAHNTLSTIRANLEGALNVTVLAARGLVALVLIRPEITADEFEKMARELMSRQKRVRNIGLGFGTTLKYVYPIKGNEAAIGLDYMKRPDQRAAVTRMIETGSTVVAGPVALVQGGFGIVSRTPIFMPSPDGGAPVYKGLVSIPIDMEGLFADAGLYRTDLPIDISIRGKDGLGEHGEVFFGNPSLFDSTPVTLDVLLPAGSWRMAAVPKGGWQQLSLIPEITAGVGVVLALLIAVRLRELFDGGLRGF